MAGEIKRRVYSRELMLEVSRSRNGEEWTEIFKRICKAQHAVRNGEGEEPSSKVHYGPGLEMVKELSGKRQHQAQLRQEAPSTMAMQQQMAAGGRVEGLPKQCSIGTVRIPPELLPAARTAYNAYFKSVNKSIAGLKVQ